MLKANPIKRAKIAGLEAAISKHLRAVMAVNLNMFGNVYFQTTLQPAAEADHAEAGADKVVATVQLPQAPDTIEINLVV